MENALNEIGYAKQCCQTVRYKAYLPNTVQYKVKVDSSEQFSLHMNGNILEINLRYIL